MHQLQPLTAAEWRQLEHAERQTRQLQIRNRRRRRFGYSPCDPDFFPADDQRHHNAT